MPANQATGLSTSRLRQVMASAGFYLLVGPLAASSAIALWMVGFLFFDDGLESAFPILIGAPLLIFFGYIFGAIPAVVTGLVVGWYRHRLLHWKGVVLAGMAGAISSAAFFCTFLYVVERSRQANSRDGVMASLEGAWLLALPSLIGALTCAWLQLRENRRRLAAQDNPSEPRNGPLSAA